MRTFMSAVAPLLVGALAALSTASAADIVHDAEYYIL